MNWKMIGNLVGLRYKLMWAKTRSRNGKIALFVTGYILLVLVLALLGAGGIGAGILAVRAGKAGMVAKVALSGLYMQAFIGTLMLGFGMNAIFSDMELRRYPLEARERGFARHLIGIVDPFWALVLFFDLGLLFGLYLLNNASLLLGLAAVLLLVISNYLLARAVGLLVDRLAQTQAGTTILIAAIMVISFLPGLLAQSFKRNSAHSQAIWNSVLAVLRFTPTFGAADAMTKTGFAAFYGLVVVAFWVLLFALALVAVERRPTARRAAETTTIAWDNRYDRFAAIFGPRTAPLVAHWLRFYTRNTRFRTLYMMTLPLVGFITFNFGRTGGTNAYFVAALGTFPILTYLGTSRIAVNQFGYVGGGFRRYFLLPTEPGACLRAGSYASVLLGGAMIPVGILVWIAVAPVPFDARMVLMLVCCALTGLFVFHGLGLWSTVYGPRKGNYSSALGNDLSLLGNIVVFSCVLTGMFLPQVLKRVAPAAVSPADWWLPVAAALAGFVFYMISLRSATALVHVRREQLMAVVEGRG